MENERTALTVTQLNEYIKSFMDADRILSRVTVRGEISNFINHKSGHFYMTLKDEGGVLRAVMFRSAAAKLKFLPENGLRIFATGRVTAYPKDGQYQLYIEHMEPDGIGELYVAYEQLRRRLEAEGLFRTDRKLPLPKIPTRIGVITSPTGAAVRDIKNILGRRFPYAEVVLYPSLVQGEEAPRQLVAGVEYFNGTSRVDVIIIGRGGGSLEDLWAFNDETLARAIAASHIPVISAVGHETDFTIADFAASCRAPTPSAAAELAVPDTRELQRKIGNIVGRMRLLLENNTAARRGELRRLASSRIFAEPNRLTDERRMNVLSDAQRLDGAVKMKVQRLRTEFVRSASKLDALNPLAILSRGYSAIYGGDGRLIRSVSSVAEGDDITFRMTDGEADCRVLEVRKREN